MGSWRRPEPDHDPAAGPGFCTKKGPETRSGPSQTGRLHVWETQGAGSAGPLFLLRCSTNALKIGIPWAIGNQFLPMLLCALCIARCEACRAQGIRHFFRCFCTDFRHLSCFSQVQGLEKRVISPISGPRTPATPVSGAPRVPSQPPRRHGEARSTVAIQGAAPLDGHAPSGLAMTMVRFVARKPGRWPQNLLSATLRTRKSRNTAMRLEWRSSSA